MYQETYQQVYQQILGGLLGVCVGDALGVPVEFRSRQELESSPITTMMGYGTYQQPPGTWSDDSSLTLCLAESLCGGFDLKDIAQSFCKWYKSAHWTAHHEVFDIGFTTKAAIARLEQGVTPTEAGGRDERSNGNGSLMRILPMAYLYQEWDYPQLMERVHEVSCITHGHLRSQIACGIYITIAIELLKGATPSQAYLQGIQRSREFYEQDPYQSELSEFDWIWRGDLATLSRPEITSGGYVIHSLEASLWCLLTTQSYPEAVLKAVNLGSDTDTTAAITGGLAGIYYGVEGIPNEWLEVLARRDDIVELAGDLAQTIS